LRALLAPLAVPVFVIPGNHDTREGMREAFGRDGYLPRLHYAVEEYPLRIVEPGGAHWSTHRMVSGRASRIGNLS